MTNPSILRIDALAVADADGFCASPGSLLLHLRTPPATREPTPVLLAAGTPADVDAHPAAAARTLSRPRSVLIPGLVNAHAHLDLTHIGPLPHDPEQGFVAWIERLLTRRATLDSDIAASVQRGINLSIAGGTVAIGDIAGCPSTGPSLAPFSTLAASPLMGVSFLEFFAIGSGLETALARIDAALEQADTGRPPHSRVRLGLQPHAPNTVEPSAYEWAAQQARARRLPLSTHLAETPEERQFIAEASGPQRDLLERIGRWEPRLETTFGQGKTPAEHLKPFLEAAKPLLAHVNDCPDSTLELLAGTNASVAYCPRASAYFGAEHHFGPHRYRDMLAAGINVCLGTDSIINLPPDSVEPTGGGLSVLDEVRLLYARDRTDPGALLRMATTSGARALGLDPTWFRLRRREPGPIAGVVAVEVADNTREDWHATVAASTGAPELLLHGKSSDLTANATKRCDIESFDV